MNPTPNPTSDTGTTSNSALISLITLIVSFLNSSHVWLQNVTFIVSLVAGCIAIYTGVRKSRK